MNPPLRRLIVGLADSKRLLGIRYSDWTIGAPSLETDISLASMAQDEWGHARLIYAMLKELDEDPDQAERDRPAAEYANIDVLDEAAADWPSLVATMVLADGALSVALKGFAEGGFELARSRVPKMLAEEEYHAPLGAAWYRRLASSERGGALLRRSTEEQLPAVLAWLGTVDEERRSVVDAKVTSSPKVQLDTFAADVGPLVAECGVVIESVNPASEWDSGRGRGPGAPADEAVVRARGDLNRALFVR